MSTRTTIVTGATGFLGRRIVETLIRRGETVRCIVRSTSNLSWLHALGVECVAAELTEPAEVQRAIQGADTVYHVAAHVADWGPWSAFYQNTVQTTHEVVQACLRCRVGRVVHVSSVAAYGHPPGEGLIDEQAPLGQNLWWWDHYARSKMLAEEATRPLGQRVTIVRPTWLFGPGDRTIMPRLVEGLRRRRVSLVGSGENRLNMVYVTDAAEGVVRAGEHQDAAGRVYNLCGRGDVTQRELFATLCQLLDLPAVKRRFPLGVALGFGFVLECLGRLMRRRTAPAVTRHGVSLISRPMRFHSDRARREIGWTPVVCFQEGIRLWAEAYLDSPATGDRTQ